MSNIEYVVSDKFKSFLPPLIGGEQKELALSIKENGIREPITLWFDPEIGKHVVIDGHNRNMIGTELKLEIPVVVKEFESEDQVKLWILENQIGRRNLGERARQVFIGDLYNLRKKISEKSRKDETTGQFTPKAEEEKVNTAQEVGEQFGVSEKTVRRAGEIAEAVHKAPEELKEKFFNKEISQEKFVEAVTPKAPSVPVPAVPPVPPVPVEPVYEQDQNAITAYMEAQGVAMGGLLRDTIQKFDKIKTNPERPSYINPIMLAGKYVAVEKMLKDALHEANELRFLYMCIACLAKSAKVGGGCDACTGGYVNYDTHQSQLKQDEKDPKFRGKNSKAEKKDDAEAKGETAAPGDDAAGNS